MVIKTAQFEVEENALDECVAAVEAFVGAVDESEPGTLVDRSLQDVDRPTRFLHIFIFADDAAEQVHTSGEPVKRFTEVLYSRTLAPVQFQTWRPVAMVDRM